MSSKSHVSPGALSVRDIRRKADNAREQAEKQGFSAPWRWRRKSGRTYLLR
jgi:hypothetical protein